MSGPDSFEPPVLPVAYAGFDLGLNDTAKPASSVSGGYESESTYLDNINAELVIV